MTKQAAKKRNSHLLSKAWQVLCWMGSSLIKVSCLLVCLMMISMLFLAGYQFLLHSQYIRLERVEITGVEEATKRELLEMSGLRSDMTLLAVNLRTLEHNLQHHPWVKSVTVEKQYPHTLKVKAVREQPWAVVSAGGLFYVNREGDVFKEVELSESVDLPVITGDFDHEEQRDLHLRLAAHVLEVLERRGKGWMREEISEVHLRNAENVSLYFRSLPAIVQVGMPDLEKKIGDLNRIVEHLRETEQVKQVTGINLHYRDGAVVSFRRG